MTSEKAPKRTLRLFLDTEFNDKVGDFRIEPISFGLVNEAGDREFYAESNEFDEGKCGPWLLENVVPHLGPKAQRLPLDSIREGVKDYFRAAVDAANKGESIKVNRIQIWAKNGAFDFVLLSLLFTSMDVLYDFLNTLGIERTYFEDTNTIRAKLGDQKVAVGRPDNEPPHHARFDARHERREYLAMQAALKPY